MPAPEDLRSTEQTTIRVYSEDRNWLLARQRAASFQRNETVTMSDLVHELIKSVWMEREGQ